MRVLRASCLALVLAAWSAPAFAEPVLIDFETLGDLDEVTTQFSALGISFSGATALVSGALGGNLNEVDFPPFSGDVAVYDAGVGGIVIDFSRAALSISGRFTYTAPLTLTAYSGATVVGTVTTPASNNLAAFGNTPNELLELAFGGGITQLVITGDLGGGSFVMDDLFADLQETTTTPVPEPTAGLVALLGTAMFAVWRRRAQRSQAARGQ